MIPIILKLVNWFTTNFKAVAVSIISLLSAISFFMYNQLLEKTKEIDRLNNNIEYYQCELYNTELQNTVLLLTLDDLSFTKDSLLNEVRNALKELKIKDKNLTNINVVNTVIKDSIKTVIKTVDKNFNEELKLNQLTTIVVSKLDSILKVKLNLENRLTLFVEEKKIF